ncbi:hypothetical protein NPS68_26035 [Escherichia coli]|uniref:hypothetical protein n=1 Tax=Escherichia coli TaxID=562 RepID=UPI002112E593|nr:hypothetical protein [Escherichia coli]MCQ6882912.1 hypothetical protein [Escherichia coli]
MTRYSMRTPFSAGRVAGGITPAADSLPVPGKNACAVKIKEYFPDAAAGRAGMQFKSHVQSFPVGMRFGSSAATGALHDERFLIQGKKSPVMRPGKRQ